MTKKYSKNLNERIKKHNSGKVKSTSDKIPVEPVTYIAFTDKYKAFAFEKYLKKGSGRAFSKN
ncbi:MAG: GIY-YIG nuclease family protein [Bacteroidota bacterium]|nr:GIY-YIG nuclease family protein [Bacteroidota bacterium]